jgi:SAM-dependent methyltransferase
MGAAHQELRVSQAILKMQAFIERWKPRLRNVPGYRAARFIYRLVQGVESRNTALLLLWPPKGLYQPYGTTSNDRYPEIFTYVREQSGDGVDLRILSVGCSTGEEVFSLRHYFSQATIVGLDINPFNIAICRLRQRKSGLQGISFSVAGSTTAQANASYDAIFAMAVFRHGDLNCSPPPPKCEHRIHFVEFKKSVTDLARILKPGGLLIIQPAMFRFEDTSVAAGFETILSLATDKTDPVYGSDNCLLGKSDSFGVVFRKIASN